MASTDEHFLEALGARIAGPRNGQGVPKQSLADELRIVREKFAHGAS